MNDLNRNMASLIRDWCMYTTPLTLHKLYFLPTYNTDYYRCLSIALHFALSFLCLIPSKHPLPTSLTFLRQIDDESRWLAV